MPNIAVNIPEGFEFLNGLPDSIIASTTELILERCRAAFSQELELVPVEPRFDCEFLEIPYVGVVWFKKIKWEQISNMVPKPRNSVILLSNVGLDCEAILRGLEKQLVAIGGDLRFFNSLNFGKYRARVYRALCQSSYCNYELLHEKDKLRKRRLAYQAANNSKFLHRWQSGASLLGIKIRHGSFFHALMR